MAYKLETYRPSGFFRLTTILLFAAALVGAVLLAWVYQLLCRWIPIIYLNLLSCVGFAFAVGGAAMMAVRWGHCRNRALALILALPLAAGALAASYGWEYWRVLGEVAEANPGVARADIEAQVTFRRFIELKTEAGWNVGHGGSGGSPLNGFWVFLVWGSEALIILGGGLGMAWFGASNPYCERCNRWGEARELRLLYLSRSDVDPLLAAGDLGGLITARAPDPPADTSVAIVLRATLCPACAETGFLSVEESRVTTTKKGKLEEKKTSLVKHAVLRADQRKRFVDQCLPLTAQSKAG